MYSTQAIGKNSKDEKFQKITIERGWTSEEDLEIDVKYCGICHTDVHIANNDFGTIQYPVVPGHEVAGVVTRVGTKVQDIAVGDHVGIGYFIDSCLDCEYCLDDDETNCLKMKTTTAGGLTKFGRVKTNSKFSYGGWSKKMTANRRFVSKIPQSFPLEKAGPCFCAGITMFTPLKEYGALKGGKSVGIAGFGGLGQIGVLLAKAMGNEVTVISSSPNKESLAKSMGADKFLVSTNGEKMKESAKSLDLILDTIAANHDIRPLVDLLKKKGTQVQLGLAIKPYEVKILSCYINASPFEVV